MTKELKRVIWEWLPGVVAGFMPLLVFLLVKAQVSQNGTANLGAVSEAVSDTSQRFWSDMTEHLIVFNIVASCVSTFTAFPRLFTYSLGDAPIGRASLGLVMLITLVLVFSVAMYTLHQARVAGAGAFGTVSILVLVTLITTLYVEVAIANLRLALKEAGHNG